MATVEVEVHPDSETLHLHVSRDCPDTYFVLPEELVVAYEQTKAAHQAACDAIVNHIEANGLVEQVVTDED